MAEGTTFGRKLRREVGVAGMHVPEHWLLLLLLTDCVTAPLLSTSIPSFSAELAGTPAVAFAESRGRGPGGG